MSPRAGQPMRRLRWRPAAGASAARPSQGRVGAPAFLGAPPSGDRPDGASGDGRGRGPVPAAGGRPGDPPADPGGRGPASAARPVGPRVIGGRMAGAAAMTAMQVMRVTGDMIALARRHTLEVAAVLLSGLGGALYPPAWLLGVGLVVAGTVLVLVIGGPHATLGSYAFEAWLGAGRLSRIAALLGAGYLLWRLR